MRLEVGSAEMSGHVVDNRSARGLMFPAGPPSTPPRPEYFSLADLEWGYNMIYLIQL